MQRVLRGGLVAVLTGGCFNPSGGGSTGEPGTTTQAGPTATSVDEPTLATTVGPPVTTSGTTALSNPTTDMTTAPPATDPGGTADDPPGECGVFTAGLDFAVCTATYLGGAALDRPQAVAVAGDGTIWIGGAFPGVDFGVVPVGTGDGAILRLTPDGRQVVGMTRLGTLVNDLALDPAGGFIAAVGDFGVATISPDSGAVLWSQPLAGALRVDVGSDGMIGVMLTAEVQLFQNGGPGFTVASVPGESLADIVVLGDDQRVVVAGNRTGQPVPPCGIYSTPFIRAHAYGGGAPVWTSYDWAADQLAGVGACAVTNAVRLTLGLDDNLYYTGVSDVASNNVHRLDPRDLAIPAVNVAFDPYSDPAMLKPLATLGYFARFSREGVHLAGQFVVARDTEKDPPETAYGTTVRPLEATALADGTVLVVGDADGTIESRAERRIDGEPVGEFRQYEPFVLVVAPDLLSRRAWAPFAAGGPGTSAGAAIGPANAVLLAAQKAGDLQLGRLKTVDAEQPDPAGEGEAWFVVFPFTGG